MADPLERPLKFNKNFQDYIDQNNLNNIFQEILKGLIISKPEDPLVFIRDGMTKFAQQASEVRKSIEVEKKDDSQDCKPAPTKPKKTLWIWISFPVRMMYNFYPKM